ncbi:MAG: GNAT family N-acetyltransferase [Bacillota bacterium]
MHPNWVIRPVTEDDFSIIAATESGVRLEPISEDQIREWVTLDRADPEFPIEWIVIEERHPEGSETPAFLGWGTWGKGRWLAPDERHIRLTVVPSKRRMGIGSFMLDYLETQVKRDNPKAIHAWGRSADKDSIQWAEKRGYVVVRERPVSELDLSGFDEEQFSADLEHLRLAGIEIRTIWDDGIGPYMQGLFQVARATHRDVPFRSPDAADLDYKSWVREYEESASRKVFAVAIHDGKVIGYSDVWMPVVDGQSALVEYTAVLKEYRGKGVGLATKVASTAAAAKAGAKSLRTTNDPDNPAILHLNQRMGFRSRPGKVLLKKTLRN